MPNMDFVHSSNINQIGYDADQMELHVIFNDGSLYVYADVPAEIFDQLQIAPSKGRYLNQEVKGVYSYDKLS